MPIQNTYIQKDSDARKDIKAQYGIVLKSIPFVPFPDLKDLPKRSWAEEQGDDVYIPPSPVFKAYDFELELTYSGGLRTAKNMIYSFLQYIQGSEFNLYDEWKDCGVRCYYKSFSDSLFYRRDEDLVTFKVNVGIANPLSYGLSLTGTTNFVALCECDLDIYWADGTSSSYVNGGTISKTITAGNEFAVVVPTKIGLISQIEYADKNARLTSSGYLRKTNESLIRY